MRALNGHIIRLPDQRGGLYQSRPASVARLGTLTRDRGQATMFKVLVTLLDYAP
jgi:hypothetical protein